MLIKKIPDTSGLVTATFLNIKINEVENKMPDQYKYITTQESNILTGEMFEAKLKRADLVNKTDFDNNLAKVNRRITSNKTKHLEVQNKLHSLITKCYIFFSGRIYFTSNDVFQNTFVY